FRCLACTHGGTFRARSRRGWMMSELLPELAAALPADAQLDGELVAYDADGRPDFHRLSARMLHGDTSLAVTYVVFAVLAPDGLATTSQPYADRRAPLSAPDPERPGVPPVATVAERAAPLRPIVA